MTGVLTEAVGGAIGLVVAAMLIGVVDILRKPGWAWKAAGEPRMLCLLLVIVVPVVGLAIYVFGARPKVDRRHRHRTGRDPPLRAVRRPGRDRGRQRRRHRRPGPAHHPRQLRRAGGPPPPATTRRRRPGRPRSPPAPTAAPAARRSRTSSGFFDDPDVLSVGAAAPSSSAGP